MAEVKNRTSQKFSQEEAIAFNKKIYKIKEIEEIKRSIGFIFSRSGFTKEAADYCKEHHLAFSSDEQWLDT